MRRISSLHVFSFLAISLAALPAAQAIDGLTNGAGEAGSLNLQILLPDEDGNLELATNSQRLLEGFNRARCLCNSEFGVRYSLDAEVSVPSLPEEEVQIFVGNGCTEILSQDMNCSRLDDIPDISELGGQLTDISYGTSDPVSPFDGTCGETNARPTLFALVDEDENLDYENQWTLELPFDLLPPPLPEAIEVESSENAASVSWDLPQSMSSDLFRVQFLCSDESGNPAGRGGDRQYITTADIDGCNVPNGVVVGDFDPTNVSGTAPAANEALPTGLATLDPSFICGTTDGNATSARLEGLLNDVTYRVVMVAIDQSGNPEAIDLGFVTPVPVTDFWERYRDAGGQAEGCQSAPLKSLAGALLVLLCLGLVRRRRRLGALLAALLFLGVAAPSSAQPYWEELDEDIQEESAGPAEVRWNFGIKVGPYRPDIDSEFSTSPGPWEQVFGNRLGVMTQAELDYYLAFPVGQLGVTASVGFMRRKASAVIEGPDGEFMRAPGDKTTFRLIPISVGAVYRFTELDDRYGIPIVPYGRLSLAYYLWRITRPSGSSATVPTDSCPMPDGNPCEGELGKNGSWGWVGSLGIAFRLERLDGERALREAGIEHAGLYAEVSLADVDGFGSSSQLTVGDLTWFGGVNFEF